MANELTLSASFAYAKNGTTFEQVISALHANVSGNQFIRHCQSVGITEEALVLGEVSGQLGWAVFANLDATNFCSIKTATSGTVMVKIPAGKFALFHFGSGVTAPFAISDTAACLLDYFISAI